MRPLQKAPNGDFTPADIDRLDDLIKNSAAIVLQLEIPVPVVEYIIEKAASFWGLYPAQCGAGQADPAGDSKKSRLPGGQ